MGLEPNREISGRKIPTQTRIEMGTMNTIEPVFANFREAFCARYGCKPTHYARKIFWKCLHRHALLPVLFTGGIEPERFQRDLEVLHQLGDASSARELEQILNDFSSVNRLERGFFRRVLRFRISGERIAALYRELSPGIQQPAPTETTAPRPASSSGSQPSSIPNLRPNDRLRPNPQTSDTEWVAQTSNYTPRQPPHAEGLEVNVVLLKKLRKIHELVTGGRSVDIAARECGLNVEQVRRAVQELAPSRPEFAWLMGYLEQSEELAALRSANQRLAGTTTSAAMLDQ